MDDHLSTRPRWTSNAVLQIVWFPAAPLWAFLMILLDVTIIYQLMAAGRPDSPLGGRSARHVNVVAASARAA